MQFQTSNSNLMLEQSMRFLWTKQAAILDNISNAETPGYKAKYVTFEESLRQRLGRSGGSDGAPARSGYRSAIEGATIRVQEASNESMRKDENSVNATEQSLEFSRNAFQLQYTMNAISTDFSTLRAAIRG